MAASANMNYGMLEVVAQKLGLSDASILKKALEISRLTEAKTSSSNQQLGLSASGLNVVSLELAANMKGTVIDRALAIKLSGASKKAYLLQMYTVESLLGLQAPSSVQDICLRLGCMELRQLAERLLARHKESSQWTEKEHPMYAAGAIFTVAKDQKVSVDKQKLSELGRTRPSKLDTVHALMVKTLSQMVGVKKSAPRAPKSRGQALLDLVSKSNSDANAAVLRKSAILEKGAEEVQDDYEEWKLRMLAEANSASVEKEVAKQ